MYVGVYLLLPSIRASPYSDTLPDPTSRHKETSFVISFNNIPGTNQSYVIVVLTRINIRKRQLLGEVC